MKILLLGFSILLLFPLPSEVSFAGTINYSVGDRNSPDYRIEPHLDSSLLAGLGRPIAVFQASAACVKDLVSRTAKAPEPAIIFILGSGFLGVGILLRRKVLKSKDN